MYKNRKLTANIKNINVGQLWKKLTNIQLLLLESRVFVSSVRHLQMCILPWNDQCCSAGPLPGFVLSAEALCKRTLDSPSTSRFMVIFIVKTSQLDYPSFWDTSRDLIFGWVTEIQIYMEIVSTPCFPVMGWETESFYLIILIFVCGWQILQNGNLKTLLD